MTGAQVKIDGIPHGRARVELQVPAGEHRIEVSARGHLPWRATVRLDAGSHLTMTPALLSSASPEANRPRSASNDVFLGASRPPVLMGKPTPSTRSAFMPTARTHTDAGFLMPAPRNTALEDAELVVPSSQARTFLPSHASSPQPSVFMSKQAPHQADVFMPAEPPRHPAVFMPAQTPRHSTVFMTTTTRRRSEVFMSTH